MPQMRESDKSEGAGVDPVEVRTTCASHTNMWGMGLEFVEGETQARTSNDSCLLKNGHVQSQLKMFHGVFRQSLVLCVTGLRSGLSSSSQCL